jgi:3-hydroxybutyryl-CoA dehydrogenase
MKIIVLATDEQWQELTRITAQINWERVTDNTGFFDAGNADAFFYLTDEALTTDLSTVTAPVFINAVDKTLEELHTLSNVYRINAWPGFLLRQAWEIAGLPDEKINTILKAIGKKITFAADEPGFIAARIIAMIINEAYFALGDKVSSKAEIDTAMKLGTNYPYGPFEWAEKIGIKNVYTLLQKLAVEDNRYQPATLLAQEATGK